MEGDLEINNPLDLPRELRVLVDFLSVDRRPTAILHLPQYAQSSRFEREVIYTNGAFRELPKWNEELRDLQEALTRTITLKQDASSLHDQVLDGKRWRTRLSGDYCIALATEASQEGLRYIRRELVRAQSSKIVNGKAAQTVSNHDVGNSNGVARDEKQSLDWTRHQVPGVTPWLDFVRNHDWASTGVGPIESWTDTLRQYVLSIMSNPNPRLICWGEDLTFIYNEACVEMFGEKHPECMGQPASVVWAEAWEDLKPMLGASYNGKVINVERYALAIERNGYIEETYWDFTMLPVFSPEGCGIGVFDELNETTALVTGERRRNLVNHLNSQTSSASTLDELWKGVLRTFEAAEVEAPFAILYAVVDDAQDGSDPAESISADSISSARYKKAALAGTAGITDTHPAAVDTFALMEHLETGPGIVKSCLQAWKGRMPITLSTEDGTLPQSLSMAIPGRSFGDVVRAALVSPIMSTQGSEILGILITGLNPRCPFNSEYQLYMQITVDFIEKAAALISLPEEQRRAQKIADELNNALAQQLRLTTLKAERSEAKFSRLAGTAPTGMFMFDTDGRALYVNDTYLEMLGQTQEEHLARRPDTLAWKDQIHEEDLERFLDTWNSLKTDKSPITLEYRLKKPWQSIDKSTGQEISGETWLLATAFPEIEADGSIGSVQGWLTDISHRKFSENLLSQRLEDALENKRQTENFIDMTSHEMRNPLSAILQSADSVVSTLSSAGIPVLNEDMSIPAAIMEDIVDAAQTIILCAQHQKRIIDDILTMSKLDASLLTMSPDKVQAPTLVTKALKMYEAELERAGIDAQLCIEPTYEDLGVDWVILDPSRLLQVIINLLTNSIKFTQHSEVRKIKVCLGASHQKPTGKHHGINFVPPRNMRPPRTQLPEWGGGEDIFLQIAVYDTGNGLNEDEMKMLFQRFQQASPKTYKQYGGSGLGLFISRELCELQGGQIGVASQDGKTVFTFFVKAKRWLPDASPEQAARLVLNRFTSAAASPVMYDRRGSVVLKEATNQMEVHTAEDGTIVEDFHPLSHRRSWAGLNSWTPNSMDRLGEGVDEHARSAPQKLHVLIVEDNQINQKVMSQQLRRAGCIVHVANHGLECLDFLDNSHFCSAATPLSVVLLDLEMPTMDGLTCIRHIRERQLSGTIISHVPVIAVTANARAEQISVAIAAGMDQVVTKPFRIPELVPQMEALVAEVAALKTSMNGT